MVLPCPDRGETSWVRPLREQRDGRQGREQRTSDRPSPAAGFRCTNAGSRGQRMLAQNPSHFLSGGRELLPSTSASPQGVRALSLRHVQLCNPMNCSSPDSCLWDFPGKNTGVGCHFLLQGIFLTQGSNPRLLHWQADPLPLSHLGSRQLQQGVLKSPLAGAVSWAATPCRARASAEGNVRAGDAAVP